MGYEINLGNEEWATGQGGMATTVTDTDTGVKEALLMGCDRNSNKTAVNKDGLLYDVLPYEPSVTYVDGVGVLNNEPQAEQLMPNSGWLGGSFPATGWGASGASAQPYQSNKYSSVFKYNFINSSYMNYPVSVVSGNKYTFSCFVEDVVITDQIANIIRAMHSGTKTYYKNGVEVVLTDNVEAGNFYSIVLESDTTESQNFRCGLGVTDSSTTSNVSVCMPQVEEGEKRTSFILSPIGSTYTRFADTGFQTPDISKWIDSSNLLFGSICSSFANGGKERQIRLTNLDSSSFISLRFSPNINEVRLLVRSNGSNIISLAYNGLDQTIKRDYRIEANSSGFKMYADDVLLITDSTPNPFTDLSVIDLGTGADVFEGQIEQIKITS